MPPERPSLREWSMFAVGWHASTWLGLALVGYSIASLNLADLKAMGPQLAMVVVLMGLGELRPIVMTRLVGNPVSFSAAFVFATLYMWGPYPAIVLYAAAVTASELLRHKAAWKLLFNVGQYTLSLCAAWLVMLAAGVHPTPVDPITSMSGQDLPWIIGSWLAYHVTNLALVALLAQDDGQTWWDSFSDEFWFYTFSAVAVLAMSPLIVLVCMADPGSWLLLPLLLLPLLAVQKTAEMSREKEYQSLHDPLTGLPNRVLLADRIEQALAHARRQPGQVIVAFLDIDRFKVVNDSLGHFVGDELLVQLAHRLAASVRPGDTLARFGGDEFVIVCNNVDPTQARTVAGRLSGCLRDPFDLDGRRIPATASIGVAIAGSQADPQTLLRDADSAMYRAKESGRGRIVIFNQGMHEEAAQTLEAESGLRRALAENEIQVHYQPIIDLRTGETSAVEALVRWQHPQLGLVGPHQFISVAEDSGLIRPLGRFVLRSALSQVRQWRDELAGAEDLRISINLSAKQLNDPDLPAVVAAEVAAAGIPPSALSLEITESTVFDYDGPERQCLSELRDLGVGLAIDDFGTGYATYSYLHELPVTALKIDRSFVGGLGDRDPHRHEIIRAIVKMADSLDLGVIAEGVETQEQLVDLRRVGTVMAQGYLWSRPLPADELESWLVSHAAATCPAQAPPPSLS